MVQFARMNIKPSNGFNSLHSKSNMHIGHVHGGPICMAHGRKYRSVTHRNLCFLSVNDWPFIYVCVGCILAMPHIAKLPFQCNTEMNNIKWQLDVWMEFHVQFYHFYIHILLASKFHSFSMQTILFRFW